MRILAILFLSLLTLNGAAAEDFEESGPLQATFQEFLNAFAERDTSKLSGLYAEEVTVLKGSTILDPNYGGLGGKTGRARSKTVTRDRLLSVYEVAVAAFGGLEDWKERAKNVRLTSAKRRFISHASPTVSKLPPPAPTDLNDGDVLAVLNPTKDAMYFVMRQIDGEWQVVAEAWE